MPSKIILMINSQSQIRHKQKDIQKRQVLRGKEDGGNHTCSHTHAVDNYTGIKMNRI
jgi:hypothetical protein